MAWNRLAPWDPKTGNLIDYTTHGQVEVGYTDERRIIDWRPADVPFEATLLFTGFERGRSAARATFQIKETGGKVLMFLKDIEDMLTSGRTVQQKMSGLWIVVKRGSDFGVRLSGIK